MSLLGGGPRVSRQGRVSEGLGYPGGRVPGGRLTYPPPPTRVHCGSRHASNWNVFFGLIHLLPYVIDFSKHRVPTFPD